jgi:nucleoside-diphosphate kinase
VEKTLIIIKPGAIQRELVGKIISRFERKGLQLCAIKMIQLDDQILNEHYSHLSNKSFFQRIKNGMMITPVIVACLKGIDAVHIVHTMAGSTNGREATQGTIRGDFSVSIQENIIHTSDSIENANAELNRFFKPEEIFDYKRNNLSFLYTDDEL